jgi:hypothetical protein
MLRRATSCFSTHLPLREVSPLVRLLTLRLVLRWGCPPSLPPSNLPWLRLLPSWAPRIGVRTFLSVVTPSTWARGPTSHVSWNMQSVVAAGRDQHAFYVWHTVRADARVHASVRMQAVRMYVLPSLTYGMEV